MINTIFDLIDNLPNPIPANSVPYFDGCNWTLIQMPASVACPDLLACFSDGLFLNSFFSSPNNTLTIGMAGTSTTMDINVAVLQ
jgi:hypothetical protein